MITDYGSIKHSALSALLLDKQPCRRDAIQRYLCQVHFKVDVKANSKDESKRSVATLMALKVAVEKWRRSIDHESSAISQRTSCSATLLRPMGL